MYHPNCKFWKIKPGTFTPEPGVEVVQMDAFRDPVDPHRARFGWMNLRARAGSVNRLEHILEIVMRIDNTVIEMATASEPLYFGHSNWGDEFNLLFLTGDDLADQFPARTVFTDTETGEQLGYVKCPNGCMTVHPVGISHWPGMLKEPHKIFNPPDELRRKVFAAVFCSAGRVDYNETLASKPSISLADWSHEPLPQFAKLKTGEIKVHHDRPEITEGRIGARNLLGMAIDSKRPLEAPEAIARVGAVTLDFITTEGTGERSFESADHSYLMSFFGEPAVEFTDASGKKLAHAQMGETDAIRIPAGVKFRFVQPATPNHAALFWMRRSTADEPGAGLPAPAAGGHPLHKVVNA